MYFEQNGDKKLFQNGLFDPLSLYTFSLNGLEIFTIVPFDRADLVDLTFNLIPLTTCDGGRISSS